MNVDTQDWPRRHRLTVDEYHRMADVGLLPPNARVELIEGEIIDMAPVGSRHAMAVDFLTERLILAKSETTIVRTQGPIRLDQRTEPEPDVALLRNREDRYAQSHPTAQDVLLIIEVSDTTLRFDRDVKGALYALYGIPEYWIVDLPGRAVHLLRDPRNGKYDRETTVTRGIARMQAHSIAHSIGIELTPLFERLIK